MTDLVTTQPADPENWSFVVRPDGAGWVPLSEDAKAERAAREAAYEASSAERKSAQWGKIVTAHIESVAKARGYDSALSLASYTTSANAAWKAEADAFVVWRDAVWIQVYSLLAQYQAGEIAEPTPESVIAALPVFGGE